MIKFRIKHEISVLNVGGEPDAYFFTIMYQTTDMNYHVSNMLSAENNDRKLMINEPCNSNPVNSLASWKKKISSGFTT